MIKASLIFKGALLASLAGAAGIAASACSSEPTTRDESNLGGIGLELTLPNGAVLSVVSFSVDGPNLASPVTGEIPVAADLAEISAYIGGLPAGSYTINLSGTSDDGGTQCLGTASFSVTADAVTGVTVPLTCDAPDGRGEIEVTTTLNKCPAITSVIVAPLTNQVGFPSNVSASGSDDDGNPLSFAWTATNGSFTDPTAATTQYTCGAGGQDTITVTVDDGSGCSVSESVDVQCRTTAVCGQNGVEPGEECDPPAFGSCNSNCQLIACGDGRVDAADSNETCEPPGTATCLDDCTDRAASCGDGWITPPEACDEVASDTCDNCQARTPSCGDGFVTPPETCDPADPNSPSTCDPTTCTVPDPGAVCDSCLQTSCTAFFDNCFQNPSVSAGCQQLWQCIETSGCLENDPYGGAQRCYCGDVDPDTCFGATDVNVPQGPCRDLIAQLSGEPLPLPIILQDNFYNTSLPHGAALSLARCEVQSCDVSCGDCTDPAQLPGGACRGQ